MIGDLQLLGFEAISPMITKKNKHHYIHSTFTESLNNSTVGDSVDCIYPIEF